MRCEICGQSFSYKPRRAVVEGVELLVCDACAKHGTGTWEARRGTSSFTGFPKVKTSTPRLPPGRKTSFTGDEEYMLAEDYGLTIKRAREKSGWSQEELGRKIQEKASFIAKIESRKVVPSLDVVRKFEHVLGVNLLTKEIPVGAPKLKPQETPELTIGDIISVGRREEKGGKPKGPLS